VEVDEEFLLNGRTSDLLSCAADKCFGCFSENTAVAQHAILYEYIEGLTDM
jgi:hypothetical protein